MKYLRKFNESIDGDISSYKVKNQSFLGFGWDSIHDSNHRVSDLVGELIIDIKINNWENEMIFITESSGYYEMFLFFHENECSESVTINDISGDLSDLIDHPLLKASVDKNNDPIPPTYHDEGSHLWTFYNFATEKGYVTIKWFGASNGYY